MSLASTGSVAAVGGAGDRAPGSEVVLPGVTYLAVLILLTADGAVACIAPTVGSLPPLLTVDRAIGAVGIEGINTDKLSIDHVACG